jgi:hypothetical protein
VKTHPNADGHPARPDMGGQCSLGVGGAGDGLPEVTARDVRRYLADLPRLWRETDGEGLYATDANRFGCRGMRRGTIVRCSLIPHRASVSGMTTGG